MMLPKKRSSEKRETVTQESGRKRRSVENFYCHLCKIYFEDSFCLCMHIMRKHRPSSKLYEDDNDSDVETEEQNGQENSQYLDISTSSHQTSEEASNDEMFNSSSSYLPESPEATHIRTEQASSSTESLLQDQIYQNILQCTSHDTQKKCPKKFDYNYENVLKWKEVFQKKFAPLNLPYPERLLTVMKVVLGILYQFCDLSADKEVVSVTTEVIKQMEDTLKRHENM